MSELSLYEIRFAQNIKERFSSLGRDFGLSILLSALNENQNKTFPELSDVFSQEGRKKILGSNSGVIISARLTSGDVLYLRKAGFDVDPAAAPA